MTTFTPRHTTQPGESGPFVLLHAHPQLSLATDKLLLPPEQVPAFADAMALAEALGRLRDGEESRIQAAVAAGLAQGIAAGRAQGHLEARQAAATEVADTTRTLVQQAKSNQQALEQQVVALALLVVRRIAASLAPEKVLAVLARQALEHIASQRDAVAASQADTPAWRGCLLHLPPALLPAVQALLGDTPGLRLIADDSLTSLDCVLDTPAGRLLAGLDTQLNRVQARLLQPDRIHAAAQP